MNKVDRKSTQGDVALLLGLFFVFYLIWTIWTNFLAAKTMDRTTRFCSVYYHVINYQKQQGSPPSSLEEVIPPYIQDKLLGKAHSDLTYRHNSSVEGENRWVLLETNTAFVRPFISDRLKASSLSGPYWENTGSPAKKGDSYH
jgi:hypothetical protein